jgi:transketolase
VLSDPASGTAQIVLVGTGSEVQHCVAAAELLGAAGVAARVVSFPSWDLFARQDASYRDDVLTPGVPRLAVEAGSSFGWERYVDATVTIDRFGASASGSRNMAEFGFTGDNVAAKARELLASRTDQD